jgi:hypothetical protein
MCMHMHCHAYKHTHINIHLYMYICRYMYMYIRTYIYIYTYTHTHTCHEQGIGVVCTTLVKHTNIKVLDVSDNEAAAPAGGALHDLLVATTVNLICMYVCCT